jgi:hypothetical protein
MDWISKAIDNLLIKGKGELNSRLECLGTNMKISGTEALGYCYAVKLDGQGNPRVNDLVELIATKIVDYSIPKKLKDEAVKYLTETGSTSKIIELENMAKTLFTDLEKTGEFGEMLLYTLTQEVLGLPQLISKMSLKTSGKLHYQGADGVHVKYDEKENALSLYWGESKMEQNLGTALKHCFDSLKGFLTDAHGYKSTQNRDLQLITSNINDNINDKKLEEHLVRYFDLDDEMSNSLLYKGICFVGFDSKQYPNKPLEKEMAELIKEFNSKTNEWLKSAGTKLSNVNLEKFELHVFLIPFPSVQEFRDHFLTLLRS